MPERNQDTGSSPEERLRAAYTAAESTTAKAFEDAVSTPSFGAVLARSAENVAAISRMGSDLADLVLRNLRVAGRSDITRLARQLHRTEDKLERVLQEVEALRDELAARERPSGNGGGNSGTNASRGRAAPNGASGSRASGTRRRNAK